MGLQWYRSLGMALALVVFMGALGAEEEARMPTLKDYLPQLALYPGGAYGPTDPTDSLEMIAKQMIPLGQSYPVDQVMAAILLKNPQAFKEGQLQTQQWLKLPTGSEILGKNEGAASTVRATSGAMATSALLPPSSSPALGVVGTWMVEEADQSSAEPVEASVSAGLSVGEAPTLTVPKAAVLQPSLPVPVSAAVPLKPAVVSAGSSPSLPLNTLPLGGGGSWIALLNGLTLTKTTKTLIETIILWGASFSLVAFFIRQLYKRRQGGDHEPVASEGIQEILGKHENQIFTQAVSEQFDLAKQYIILGDFDQAKSILSGFISSGSEQERAYARSILSRFS